MATKPLYEHKLTVKPRLLEFFKQHKWTQGTNAADANGRTVSTDDPAATSFCLRGAVMKAYGKCSSKTRDIVSAKLQKAVADLLKTDYNNASIVSYNDASGRKKSEITRVLKKAGV